MNCVEEARLEVTTRSVVLGTAGHIDHGKTALVLALTGTDTDRLPEEKARGITIDLGFAALDLDDRSGGPIHMGLIDVPGHQAFIHNMLAGAGGIDCVMLVIAADEGVKAQTIEHLAICSLLGVQNGLVVLTKKDAVSAERLEEAWREVSALAQGTFLQSSPVLAVSALTGEGIFELKQALIELARRVPEHSSDTLLRLPVDRAFSVPGFGTVITGTLRDGSVRVADTVQLQPAGRTARVRGIQIHHRTCKEAHAPTRTALNLAGVEVGDVHRGDMIVQQGTLAAAHIVDVELTLMPGIRPLRHRAQVGFHAFASQTFAAVLLYLNESGGGYQLARLKLREPLLLLPGDRFVLRRPGCLVGGGRILDAHPMPRWRKAAARGWLEQIRDASREEKLLLRVQRRGVDGISLKSLSQETGLREEAIRAATEALIGAGAMIGANVEHVFPDHFICPQALNKAVEGILSELRKKEGRSSARAELLSRTRLPQWVFEIGLRGLREEERVRVSGSEISLKSTGATQGKADELLARVEKLYRSAGLAPPLVSEAAAVLKLAPGDLAPLNTLLLRSGKLIRMGSDGLLVHADAVAKLKADLGKIRGQTVDVGRFKTMTGVTRKYAIPLLEYLDRARVTENRNGVRKVL